MLWVVLVFGLCSIVVLGYFTYRLNQERNGLITELESEQHKCKILQSKYAEQKAQTTTLLRAKLAVDGQMRKIQQELDAVKEAKSSLEKELTGVEEKYNSKVAGLEKRIERYTEQLQKLVENRDQYKAKLAETVAIVRERNEMIYKLTGERDDLTAGLQETTSTLKRCVKHNARLSQLSEEVVTAYENKGIGTSLIQSEPFTQIKKVELEKLIQQYRDRIDNDNLQIIQPKR